MYSKYYALIQELEFRNQQEDTYVLSLLYQLIDDYDHEKLLIEEFGLQNESEYWHKRWQWHQLPFVKKLVPRKPLHLPRDPDTTPPQEVLEQLCFASAADSGLYFELLKDCVMSVKSTRLYKDIPFYVFDEGLTDSEKQELLELGITAFVEPGWPSIYKTGRSKIIIDQLIPGYRYYFHVDADVWVQDERGLDDYINLCLEQNIGIAGQTIARNKRKVNGGIWVIDSQSKIFEKWESFYKQTLKHPRFKNNDQPSLMLAIKELKAENFLDNRVYNLRKFSNVTTYNSILNQNDQIICCIHKVVRIEGEFLDTLGKKYIARFNKANDMITDRSEPDFKSISLNYRDYPWKNKNLIEAEIKSFVEGNIYVES